MLKEEEKLGCGKFFTLKNIYYYFFFTVRGRCYTDFRKALESFAIFITSKHLQTPGNETFEENNERVILNNRKKIKYRQMTLKSTSKFECSFKHQQIQAL